MTKYVYVVTKHDLAPYESYHDGIHKVFASEKSAESYVEDNKNKVFPKEREHWDLGYRVSRTIYRVVLEE